MAFSPPVTQEEERLRGRIAAILRSADLEAESLPAETKAALQGAVEKHFDYLSAQSDRMLADLREQVDRLAADADRRKAARRDLVDAEVSRILHEARRVTFSPALGALMRNTPGRRSPESARNEQVPSELK